jgi:16S rRNA (guanine527-N7)-methyltransferase
VARSTDGGFRAPLLALGLAEPAVALLDPYLRLLSAWNRRINLTAARTPRAQVALLIEPVLPLMTLLAPGDLIDVGSGNGSPGLVLAALEPNRRVCLLEPRTRRWAFLREAARTMGRPDIRVLRCRHDAYPGPPAPNLTLRALRVAPAELDSLLSAEGRIYVLGTRPSDAAGFVLHTHRAPGQGAIHVLSRSDVSRETRR